MNDLQHRNYPEVPILCKISKWLHSYVTYPEMVQRLLSNSLHISQKSAKHYLYTRASLLIKYNETEAWKTIQRKTVTYIIVETHEAFDKKSTHWMSNYVYLFFPWSNINCFQLCSKTIHCFFKSEICRHNQHELSTCQ